MRRAKKKLSKRKEQQNQDKVLAELNFGFWTSLFNAKVERILLKDLRLVFAHCPKEKRQRGEISPELNTIRNLRN
ncbi:MAG: hypothetical protein LBU76_01705 [Azoarcus sp.]|nr:hypothetical protein [Azoarcus sp.]